MKNIEESKDENGNLFVGDLPFSFKEQDVMDKFSKYGEILECKIMRGDTGKSLAYGFIKFASCEVAQQVIDIENGAIVQGRALRMNWASHKSKGSPKPAVENNSSEIHISFRQISADGQISRMEEILRRHFSQYGQVTDVAIKKMKVAADASFPQSNGYAFVHYPADKEGIDASLTAVRANQTVDLEGVNYRSFLTYKLRAKLEQNGYDLSGIMVLATAAGESGNSPVAKTSIDLTPLVLPEEQYQQLQHSPKKQTKQQKLKQQHKQQPQQQQQQQHYHHHNPRSHHQHQQYQQHLHSHQQQQMIQQDPAWLEMDRIQRSRSNSSYESSEYNRNTHGQAQMPGQMHHIGSFEEPHGNPHESPNGFISNHHTGHPQFSPHPTNPANSRIIIPVNPSAQAAQVSAGQQHHVTSGVAGVEVVDMGNGHYVSRDAMQVQAHTHAQAPACYIPVAGNPTHAYAQGLSVNRSIEIAAHAHESPSVTYRSVPVPYSSFSSAQRPHQQWMQPQEMACIHGSLRLMHSAPPSPVVNERVIESFLVTSSPHGTYTDMAHAQMSPQMSPQISPITMHREIPYGVVQSSAVHVHGHLPCDFNGTPYGSPVVTYSPYGSPYLPDRNFITGQQGQETAAKEFLNRRSARVLHRYNSSSQPNNPPYKQPYNQGYNQTNSQQPTSGDVTVVTLPESISETPLGTGSTANTREESKHSAAERTAVCAATSVVKTDTNTGDNMCTGASTVSVPVTMANITGSDADDTEVDDSTKAMGNEDKGADALPLQSSPASSESGDRLKVQIELDTPEAIVDEANGNCPPSPLTPSTTVSEYSTSFSINGNHVSAETSASVIGGEDNNPLPEQDPASLVTSSVRRITSQFKRTGASARFPLF